MVDINELLKRIAERCRGNLSGNERAKVYLRENGIDDARAFEALRIGIADLKLLGEFSADERAALESAGLRCIHGKCALNPSGILFPMVNPAEPEKVIGFVKQNYIQNKHAFITARRGLACGSNIGEHKKLVIADAPLLALRLAQAGVKGVALAEVPEVLPEFTDWLASREIVLASYKPLGAEALKSALGSIPSSTAILTPELMRSAPEALALLGLSREKRIEPAAILSPALLSDLVKFAQARVANGEGLDLLREYGADDRAFIEAYGVGFLPTGFQSALSAEARKAFANRLEGNSLLIPAFDESGAVCDVMAQRPLAQRRAMSSVLETPAGLFAPKIAGTFEDLTVTDSFRLAAKLFRAGKQNVLVLRGAADARNNAKRLALAGVQSATVQARREGAEIAKALENAGITSACEIFPRTFDEPKAEIVPAAEITAPVEPVQDASETLSAVSMTDSVQRVSLDRKTEQAGFKAGEVSYTVDAPRDGGTKLTVRLEVGGKIALDKFDVAVEAQRKRFASSAALKLKVPCESIDGHLVSILDELQKWSKEQTQENAPAKPAVEISDAERAEGLALLQCPDVLDVIASDLESLGWVGEEDSKRLLYLVGISRKLPAPLSGALLASSGAGKSKSIETVARLTPAEDLVHVSRLTDSALYYQDKNALRHKLLVVDEADALTPEVLVSLRILQSRGALTQSHVLRDQVSGAAVTHFIETRGPVSILTSSAGKLEEQMLSRCFEIGIDESPEQTARILESQRRLRTDPDYQGNSGRHAQLVRKHHTLQRLLDVLPVVIPFAARIQFPASSIKHRREQERFLNLIEASALLHQHQRLKHKSAAGEAFIIADMRDYETAMKLAAGFVGRSSDELSSNGREVLQLVQGVKQTLFTLDDLQRIKPEWTRYRFRAGLDELLAQEVLTSPKSGRGKVREYQLNAVASAMFNAPTVKLLAVGELAKVGEMDFAKLNPVQAIG